MFIVLFFLRNKRLEKIDEAFWEFATNIPLDYKKCLKQDEQEYLNNYKDLISDYSKAIGFDLTKVIFCEKSKNKQSFYRIYNRLKIYILKFEC